eukprot:COSAG06_NODE_4970_length_3819_cov_407.165646_1_plen_533_part_10
MGRKFAVMFVTTFFDSSQNAEVAWTACLVIIVVSWALHRWMMPWADTVDAGYAPVLFRPWTLNDLEEASLVTMLLSMFMTGYFVFIQEIKGDSSMLTVSIASMVLVVNAAMLVLAGWLWLEGRFNPLAQPSEEQRTEEELDQEERFSRAPASWTGADREAMYISYLKKRTRGEPDSEVATAASVVRTPPSSLDMQVSPPVSPHRSSVATVSRATALLVVEFVEEGSLGIVFNGKVPPTITRLLDEGLASRHTKLQSGLILRTIQEQPISHMHYKQALQAIKASKRPLRLGFEKPPSVPKHSPHRPESSSLVEAVRNPLASMEGSGDELNGCEVEKLRRDIADLAGTIQFLTAEKERNAATGGSIDEDDPSLLRLEREYVAMVQQLSTIEDVYPSSTAADQSEQSQAASTTTTQSPQGAALDAWLDSGMLGSDDASNAAPNSNATSSRPRRARVSMTFDDSSSEDELSSETESGSASQQSQLSETALRIKQLRERNRIAREMKRRAVQLQDDAEPDDGHGRLAQPPPVEAVQDR